MSNRYHNIRSAMRDYDALCSSGLIGGEILVRKTQVKSGQKRRMADAILAGFEADNDVMEGALETMMVSIKTEIAMATLEIKRATTLEQLQAGHPEIAPQPQQRMITSGHNEYDVPMSTYASDGVINTEATKIAMAYPKTGNRGQERSFEKACVAKMRQKGFSPETCEQVIDRVHELITDVNDSNSPY